MKLFVYRTILNIRDVFPRLLPKDFSRVGYYFFSKVVLNGQVSTNKGSKCFLLVLFTAFKSLKPMGLDVSCYCDLISLLAVHLLGCQIFLNF